MTETGIIWDERYLHHDTGEGHPERPERLLAIKEVLDSHSQLIHITPRFATTKEIGWVHSPEHIERVESMRGVSRAYFDGDTPVSAGSTEAAFLAAGGVISLIEHIEAGELANGFAFPRPPGHHAEESQAMGFCLFNNVAIAAEYLIKATGKQRIAIMDYDVHHGNGTQHSFYQRSDVFYLSTHRFPFYPGTGSAGETGLGAGEGFTCNVPLNACSDDADYTQAFEEEIVPAMDKYKPEFILVSAGFDAHQRDPLGGMKVSQAGFVFMSRRLVELAKRHCEGKIIFVLEGGYDLKGLQEGVEAVLEEL